MMRRVLEISDRHGGRRRIRNHPLFADVAQSLDNSTEIDRAQESIQEVRSLSRLESIQQRYQSLAQRAAKGSSR